MRNYDHAPIKNTCPKIDSIIDRMEKVKQEAEYINNNPNEDSSQESSTIIDEIFEAIKEMEEIREANSKLRDWGNDLAEELDEAISDKENLAELHNESLEEVDNLTDKIEELTKQLEQDD